MSHCVRLQTVPGRVPKVDLRNILRPLMKTEAQDTKGNTSLNVFRTTAQNSEILERSLTTNTMTKPFAILFTVISMAAMAAAGIIEPAHAAVRRSTPTTCVTGPPASTSGYDIEYAAVGDPAAGNRFYDIDPAFSADHSVGSAMVSRSPPLHELCLLPPPAPNALNSKFPFPQVILRAV